MIERIILEWDESQWVPGVFDQLVNLILCELEAKHRIPPDRWVNESLVADREVSP